jgi:crotonobetainyl-CoA:carnitine CoA-transferase CaiB-like acyl-CoA transferase
MGAVSSSSPTLCRSGQSDHTTALNLLASTLVAHRLKDATGEPQTVEVTLQRTGIWTISVDMSQTIVAGEQPSWPNRAEPGNPLGNCYETRDGQWVLLLMPTDPYWPPFCRMVGRDDWLADPSRATIFRGDDMASWATRLDDAGLIWGSNVDIPTVARDPQPRLVGAFETVTHPDPTVGDFETLAALFRIEGAEDGVLG